MPLFKIPTATVSCFSFFHPFWLLRRGLVQPQTDWIPVRVGECEFPFPLLAGKDLHLRTPVAVWGVALLVINCFPSCSQRSTQTVTHALSGKGVVITGSLLWVCRFSRQKVQFRKFYSGRRRRSFADHETDFIGSLTTFCYPVMMLQCIRS